MYNFINDKNDVFWFTTPKKLMWKSMDTMSERYPCDKKVVIINSTEYRNTNGYRDLAEQITVDYETDNLIFVELEMPGRECVGCQGT